MTESNSPTPVASHAGAVTIFQFTDTHLFADPTKTLLGVNTEDSLRAVLDRARRIEAAPAAILATGDLSQDETAEAYTRFAATFAAYCGDLEREFGVCPPVYWLAGNHDKPDLMADIFTAPPMQRDRDFRIGGWNVILLNSHLDDEVGGRLAEEELTRLDALLGEYRDRHTLVCLHHNAVPTHNDWLGDIGLGNPEEFFAVIDRHANVRCILWGHIHQDFRSERKGVRLLATPSTCIQFAPDRAEFGLDDQPPGFRRLVLHPDGRIDSEVIRVDADAVAKPDFTSTGY